MIEELDAPLAPRIWTFRLTRAGWALLPTSILLTLGAINSGLNVTYLLACLAITIFLAGVIAPLWSGRGLDCRREIPEPPYAGEPFDYTLVVTSRRRSVARLVRVLDPLGGPKSAGKLIVRIPPKGTVRIPCVGAPLRRGAHPMPPLEWRSGFPFGLAECGARLRAGGELLVYPARGLLARPAASPGKPVAARAGVPSITGTSPKISVRCANTIPATACAGCTGAPRPTAASCTCARSSASASRRR